MPRLPARIGPRTLVKLTARQRETQDRALSAVRVMRDEDLSLSRAARREGVSPATVRRYVPGSLEKRRGRWHARGGYRDRTPREMETISRWPAGRDHDLQPESGERACEVQASRPALPTVDPGPESALMMGLYSRSQFVEDVLYRRCYEARAMLLRFNLPFDLTRLALGWGRCRRGAFAGGFSLYFHRYQDSNGVWKERGDRPRVRLKSLGQRRSLISFAAPAIIDRANRVPEGAPDGRPRRDYSFPGHFLDLMTLCFALTGRHHSLESGCAPNAFDVRVNGRPYRKRKVTHGRVTARNITYCREDVEGTAGLFVKAIAEHERHPINQPAEKIYSPASYTKGYLRALGIKPPLQRNRDFPTEVIGYSIGARTSAAGSTATSHKFPCR